MNVPGVTESTTETASAGSVDTKEPSGSKQIGESAVEHMPNRDERFENLLPLVPGVVRGPNGLVNLRKARWSTVRT